MCPYFFAVLREWHGAAQGVDDASTHAVATTASQEPQGAFDNAIRSDTNALGVRTWAQAGPSRSFRPTERCLRVAPEELPHELRKQLRERLFGSVIVSRVCGCTRLEWCHRRRGQLVWGYVGNLCGRTINPRRLQALRMVMLGAARRQWPYCVCRGADDGREQKTSEGWGNQAEVTDQRRKQAIESCF